MYVGRNGAASGEFFKKAILPELVAKFYSRSGMLSLPESQGQSANKNSADANPEPSYCYCGGPEDAGDMIACDDEECKLQWYHLHCLKIKRVRKGNAGNLQRTNGVDTIKLNHAVKRLVQRNN